MGKLQRDYTAYVVTDPNEDPFIFILIQLPSSHSDNEFGAIMIQFEEKFADEIQSALKRLWIEEEVEPKPFINEVGNNFGLKKIIDNYNLDISLLENGYKRNQ